MCRIITRVPFVSRPEVDGKCGFSDWIFFVGSRTKMMLKWAYYLTKLPRV